MTGRASIFLIANVVIVDTKVSAPVSGESYFQVTVGPDHEQDAAGTVLVTRDSVLYELALFAEGTPQRFDAQWSPGTRPGGKRCQVLVKLVGRRPAAERAAS